MSNITQESNANFNSTLTLLNLGAITVNMQTCPFQPPISTNYHGPRFFGNDGTGAFWGIQGFYRTIPCWRGQNTIRPVPYQAYTFSLSASGFFINSYFNQPPFTYTAALSATAITVGQLTVPSNNNPSDAYNATPGLEAIYLTNNIADNIAYSSPNQSPFQSTKYLIQSVPLTFVNTTQGFSALNQSTCYPILVSGNTAYNAAFLPYTLLDDYGAEWLIDRNNKSSNLHVGGTNNTYNLYYGWSPYTSMYGAPAPAYITRNGVVSWPLAFANFTYTVAKVNPVNGNAIFGASAFLTGGSGFFFTNVLGANAGNSYTYTFTPLALSNSTDNTNFTYNSASIQQLPGGGWLVICGTGAPYNIFYIPSNMSGYYNVSFSNLPSNAVLSAETLAVDLNGFFYCLYYSSSTSDFSSMYWSGSLGGNYVFTVPQLQRMNVPCIFDS
jgi:hypothetical protein